MKKNLTLLEQVTLSFEDVQVYKNLTLTVPQGAITTIVGPSGCGKSSMLNLLAGLILPDKGRVCTAGETVGYVFQEDRLLPWATVYDNVKLVRPGEDREAIMAILAALELSAFGDKFPGQLSGGMRQRCAIARGFYYDASLLLMDEPFKSLDYDLRLNLMGYLGRLWEKTGNTILFVTHDIDEALLLGHEILVMGKEAEGIVATFKRSSPLEARRITDEAHDRLRRKIIGHLTTTKETEV